MSRDFDLSTKGFEITESDEASPIAYFLFLDRYGNWLIKRLETLSATETSYRYLRGSAADDFVAIWANRASLTYKYYNEVF